MIHVRKIDVDGKTVLGLEVELPDSPPLVMLICKKGFIMCGFLNIEAADKLGVSAAVIAGVSNVNEMLESEVKHATTKAKKLGIKNGMKGIEAVKLLI
ncbi:DUF1805 domain-containing protein [Thermococci archaeon]|nr:MAG: DUF1805 domain-containing protein [Thermococci archaeon]